MNKLSEQVRRLEDTIESLRRDNKELREKLKQQEPQQKEFMITYKGPTTELPTEGNKEGDMYTISYKDRMTGKIITDKWVRYKNKWSDSNDVARMISDERDEIIDHQKWDIEKLKKELGARVKQVEDLQSSYKTLQKENERLKAKLEQTVDEYDEDYQTFHNCKNTGKYEDDIEFMNDIKKLYGSIFKR